MTIPIIPVPHVTPSGILPAPIGFGAATAPAIQSLLQAIQLRQQQEAAQREATTATQMGNVLKAFLSSDVAPQTTDYGQGVNLTENLPTPLARAAQGATPEGLAAAARFAPGIFAPALAEGVDRRKPVEAPKPEEGFLTTLLDEKGVPQRVLVSKQLDQNGRRVILGPAPVETGTTVNVNPGENAFNKSVGEALGTDLVDQRKTVANYARSLPRFQQVVNILPNVRMGQFANFAQTLDKTLKATGIDIGGTRATDTETFVNLMKRETIDLLATRATGSGTAVSDADREFISRIAGEDIKAEPGTIRRVLAINIQLKIEELQDFQRRVDQVPPESRGLMGLLNIPNIPQTVKAMEKLRDRLLRGQERDNADLGGTPGLIPIPEQ